MDKLVDAHCHVVTDPENTHCGDAEGFRGMLRCVMSSNPYDWSNLKQMTSNSVRKDDIRVGFGVHPWYSHLFYVGASRNKLSHYQDVLEYKDKDQFDNLVRVLPEPIDLEGYIAGEFDDALVSVVGEVGLDKLFRLPTNGFYVQGEKARLTSVKVRISHQEAVFRRFCRLATHAGIPISIHDVKCHGKLNDICNEELLPCPSVKICLHSYTGSTETLLGQWLKKFPSDRVFVSLSKWINFKDPEEGKALVRSLPPNCILTETDFPIDNPDPTYQGDLMEQLRYLNAQIAQAWDGGLDASQAALHVYENFQRFIE
ncbi:YMR262W [Saccharomyces arboricola H-6]|uniref:YMR262W n=1 Tax=Saccharomyces arboricola (strain H-6 / AS 2.3317 / CBS 10644) TaxID=1160507 RepID=J8Q3A2_SACAR|nr:YMR262W [Saccharomyces arboricola H-6]